MLFKDNGYRMRKDSDLSLIDFKASEDLYQENYIHGKMVIIKNM